MFSPLDGPSKETVSPLNVNARDLSSSDGDFILKQHSHTRRFTKRRYLIATFVTFTLTLAAILFYILSLWRPAWPLEDARAAFRSEVQADLISLDPLNPISSLNGPPSMSFRDNMKPGARYITSWAAAGWTNDVLTYINLIYLGLITDRIPVLPPFTPSHINMGAKRPVPPISFGEVFDVPRLRSALGTPILEWSDIKLPRSDILEELGCWNVWEAVQFKEHRPRRSDVPRILHLDISYTRMPETIKLYPGYEHDMHATFWNLAKFAYPETRNANLVPPLPSPNYNVSLPPDESMLCFDYLYYVCASVPFDYASDYSPTWRVVGQHLHWTPPLQSLAESFIKKSIGFEQDEDLPPYIGIHARHADFANYCPSSMTAEERLTDCFASIPVIATRVEEVKAEIKTTYGIDINYVIMTSDERDPAWWHEVQKLGWWTIDHRETKEIYGDWYPVLIDAVIQSSGLGFVGTDRSTMSIIARQRVEAWAGDSWLQEREDLSERLGTTRMVRWGKIGADDL